MSILMTTLTWMVKNIHNRNTTEEFTEEIDAARFEGQKNFFYLPISRICQTVQFLSRANLNFV